MKIAVVITGDVRNSPMKQCIKDIYKDHDIFVGSYVKHQSYIEEFTKNHYLVDETVEIRNPKTITKKEMQQNMLQWLHLDNVLMKFKDQLLSYDVIMKCRFDYKVNEKDFFKKISVQPNVLYNHSDMMFYAESNTFFKVFEDYYDKLNRYTFHQNREPHDDSFQRSWKSEPALQMHLKSNKIKSVKMHFSQGILMRGSYNKTVADGNKRLYDENGKLLGKFTVLKE